MSRCRPRAGNDVDPRRHRSRISSRVSRVAIALLLASCPLALNAATDVAGNEVQHCEYRIAWNGIPAASATIDITMDRYGDQMGYVVSTRAATNAFVDLFWHFRGNARATVLAAGLTPLSFSFDRRANSTSEVTWIDFDQTAARAESVYIKRERRKELAADARVVVDPITAALRALSSDVRVGDALRYEIFTGESHYEAVLRIAAEERVEVPAGQFDALRVEPEVFKVGTERRPDNRLHRANIWVTRTPRRTILRIRSQVLIGAVTLDLVRANRQLTSS